MSKIVSIHSYRGGTGKSNSTANIALLLAEMGWRVGVVDTDIQSPGIHVLFGLSEGQVSYALNDYLWGRCEMRQAAYDVTPLGLAAGKIFLLPSSTNAGEIARVLREGYDVELLTDGFHRLVAEFSLDVLLIDTHPGLNEETLLSIAISHTLLIILRPDQQDYLGTSVTVDVARKLEVPRLLLLLNKLPLSFDPYQVRTHVEQTYACPVAGVLPHSEEMMALASGGLFALHHPQHPITLTLREVAKMLVRD
jgi:septum site-determining protein MinD